MATATMLGGPLQKIIDIFTGFFAIIPQFTYFLYASIASLLDLFQFIIRKLAGLDVYYINTAEGLQERTGDIVTDIIQGILGINDRYSALNTVFWSMVIFGIIVLFVMTIISIIKAHYNYDAQKSQPTYILKSALKSLATMAIVPITVLFGLYLNSALFQTLDKITTPASDSQISKYFEAEAINKLDTGQKGGDKVYSSYDYFGAKDWSNTTSFSGILFSVCGYDANRVRYEAYTPGSGEWDDAGIFYLDNLDSMSVEAAKESIANQIDFAFENNLTLSNAITIQLSGSESQSAIASSLTFGPSAAYAFGLINVDHFSKFNIGLVWYYYNLWAFNFLIAFGAIAILFTSLGSIVFGMMLRILLLSILFICYPPLVGITPLDGGNAVKSWRSNFISHALSAYMSVVTMNLCFMLLPFFRSISFFNVAFLDGLVSIVIIIAALTMVKKFCATFAEFVGAKNIEDMGQGIRKDGAKPVAQGTTALVKTAGAAVSFARIEYGIKKNISNNIEKNRANKIYVTNEKLKTETDPDKRDKLEKRLKRYKFNKSVQEAPTRIAKKGIKALKKVKSSKAFKRAQNLFDNDITKVVLSRFGVPIDSKPRSYWEEYNPRDEKNNPILDENGDPVVELVRYERNEDGSIKTDHKGKPIIAERKKSQLAILKDAMVDFTGMTFKAVGDLSGVKNLLQTQSGAIDAAKTKLNELTKGIAALAGKKGLFKTKEDEEDEEEEKELAGSTLDIQLTDEDTENVLNAVHRLVEEFDKVNWDDLLGD